MGRWAQIHGGVVLTSVSCPTSLDSRCASTTSRLPRLSRSAAASTSWARLSPTSRACGEGIRWSGLLSLLLGLLTHCCSEPNEKYLIIRTNQGPK